MTKLVEFRFDCPNPKCSEPWAHPIEDVIDIHGGATFHCADCGAAVMFFAETVEQALKEIQDELGDSR